MQRIARRFVAGCERTFAPPGNSRKGMVVGSGFLTKTAAVEIAIKCAVAMTGILVVSEVEPVDNALWLLGGFNLFQSMLRSVRPNQEIHESGFCLLEATNQLVMVSREFLGPALGSTFRPNGVGGKNLVPRNHSGLPTSLAMFCPSKELPMSST